MLPIGLINQNLEALSLDELLEVSATVNALIARKTLKVNQSRQTLPSVGYYSTTKSTKGSFLRTTVINKIADTDIFPVVPPSSVPLLGASLYTLSKLWVTDSTERSFREGFDRYRALQSLKQMVDREDNSLETVINLVDEWMNDESGYDEEAYPQVEEGLKENRTSL